MKSPSIGGFKDCAYSIFASRRGHPHSAVVSRQKLLKIPVMQLKNKMVPMGDYFYEINLQDVEFINLLAK